MRGVSRQAIHQQLDNGRYRAVKTRVGWLIDPGEADRIERERSK
jgi:hypothetical protein